MANVYNVNPCSLFREAVGAVLKCLGFESITKPSADEPNGELYFSADPTADGFASEAQQWSIPSKSPIESGDDPQTNSRARSTPKPPIGSGDPPQTNSSLSVAESSSVPESPQKPPIESGEPPQTNSNTSGARLRSTPEKPAIESGDPPQTNGNTSGARPTPQKPPIESGDPPNNNHS